MHGTFQHDYSGGFNVIKFNQNVISFETLPNGEKQFDLQQVINSLSYFEQANLIFYRHEKEEDLLELFYLKKYLDSLDPKPVNRLIVSRLPYPEQSTVQEKHAPLQRYVADFINAMQFESVFFHEAHTESSAAHYQNSMNLKTTLDLFERAKQRFPFDGERDLVVYPNLDAMVRYREMESPNLLQYLSVGGNLTAVPEQLTLDSSSAVILDDVLSEEKLLSVIEDLKAKGISSIYLVTPHVPAEAEEAQFLDDESIKAVYATDTLQDDYAHEKIHMILTTGWNESAVNEIEPPASDEEQVLN